MVVLVTIDMNVSDVRVMNGTCVVVVVDSLASGPRDDADVSVLAEPAEVAPVSAKHNYYTINLLLLKQTGQLLLLMT